MFWTTINIIVWIIAIASLLSAISPITKTTRDDAFVKKFFGIVQSIVDVCALNVGKVRKRFKE